MGETALLAQCQLPDIDLANRLVLALGRTIDSEKIVGVKPCVIGIASVLVRYDPLEQSPIQIEQHIAQLTLNLEPMPATPEHIIEIPVVFGGERGIDLPDVAQTLNLTQAQVITHLCAKPLRVMAIGFAMGHPYLGPLPAVLYLPRRATPRPKVPPGSVAIAAGMANIYPVALPGGWHIIGHTDVSVFDPYRNTQPSLLAAGDGVLFINKD